MPRKYVKKVGGRAYLRYTSESMDAAVEAVREKGISRHEAARIHGVPYGTLRDKLNGSHSKTVGGQTVLSRDQEADLRECIRIAGEWGFPFTPDSVATLVKSFLDSNRIITKFRDNIPGKDWFDSFMKRSETLTTRWSENIKRNRAKVSPTIVNDSQPEKAQTG